jgi:hypothetical protein
MLAGGRRKDRVARVRPGRAAWQGGGLGRGGAERAWRNQAARPRRNCRRTRRHPRAAIGSPRQGRPRERDASRRRPAHRASPPRPPP